MFPYTLLVDRGARSPVCCWLCAKEPDQRIDAALSARLVAGAEAATPDCVPELQAASIESALSVAKTEFPFNAISIESDDRASRAFLQPPSPDVKSTWPLGRDRRTIIAIFGRTQAWNASMRSRPITSVVVRFAMMAAALSTGGSAAAQMPGAPTLQNAFVNPGITAALDASGLGGATTYAAAAAWAPGSARFQFSGGIGAQLRTGASTRTAYGARLNFPVMGAASSFGLSVFAGYGAISGGGAMDSSVAKALIPVGATASYRRAIGSSRGVSIYGSPIFESVTRGGNASRASVFRGAIGMDLGITSAIGLTLGVELGSKQAEGAGKPAGTAFGAALSYALGAKR